MELTPTPDNASEIGAMAVPFVESNYGATLDYGVYSLRQIDSILDDLRRDQKFEDVQPVLFSIGCYVGEVLVRRAKGRWCRSANTATGAVASAPIVIQMPSGRGCNPIGMVYRRFANGPQDSIASFYQSVVSEPRASL